MSNSQSGYRTENSESHDPTLRSCALEFAPITHLRGDWSFPMNVISFVTTASTDRKFHQRRYGRALP